MLGVSNLRVLSHMRGQPGAVVPRVTRHGAPFVVTNPPLESARGEQGFWSKLLVRVAGWASQARSPVHKEVWKGVAKLAVQVRAVEKSSGELPVQLTTFMRPPST